MYQEFRKVFNGFPVITLADIHLSLPDFDMKNLIYWQKKGYVIKLRNGYYMFTDYKTTEHTLFHIANELYDPSYVSMESALSHYGLIPEGVYSIQSISTRKTNQFETPIGTFHYYKIKSPLYFGYTLLTDGGAIPCRMASMEKAVLDFLYLRSDVDDYAAFEAVRWNRDELAKIDTTTMEEYLQIFQSKTLQKKIDWLYTYIHA